jgi:hypothetical protein
MASGQGIAMAQPIATAASGNPNAVFNQTQATGNIMASGQGIAMAQPIVNQASVPVAYEKEVAMKNAELQAVTKAGVQNQMEDERRLD